MWVKDANNAWVQVVGQGNLLGVGLSTLWSGGATPDPSVGAIGDVWIPDTPLPMGVEQGYVRDDKKVQADAPSTYAQGTTLTLTPLQSENTWLIWDDPFPGQMGTGAINDQPPLVIVTHRSGTTLEQILYNSGSNHNWRRRATSLTAWGAWNVPLDSSVYSSANPVAPSTTAFGGESTTLSRSDHRHPIEIKDTGWQRPTLLNAWVDYDTRVARYRRIGNVVMLQGLIKNGTVPSTAFVLPAGYRHNGGGTDPNHHFACVSNGAFGYALVKDVGDIAPTVGSNLWFDLAGIRYFTDDAWPV